MSYLDNFDFEQITNWDLKQVNQTVQHAVKMALPFLLAELEPHIGFMIKEQIKNRDDDAELDNEIDNDVLAEALRYCLGEGWVDEEIESRIGSVLDNGSWDFDISFSA
jgi:hypothetical protein